MKPIVVIGGGIAGLSAAYYASKNIPDAHITVIESSGRWGGKISSERLVYEEDLFVIEGGPDTFLATKPWAVTLCKELGLGGRLHGTNPRQKDTYVLHDNLLQPLPDGLAMMIPTNIPAMLRTHLVSWSGKARMGLDFLLPPHSLNGDESLGAFVSRRLGREAYENLIEPLMSGVYAGDGDALSLASTFPYLRDLEIKYGSLARGALEMRKQSSRGNGKSSLQGSRSAFLTPTTGLAEIVESLVEYLGAHHADLRLNSSVQTLSRSRTGTWNIQVENGETLTADSVIIAAPAFAAGEIVSALDPQLAADLQAIPYASTATVSVAYRSRDLPRPLDGYGYVIPRREGRRALACTWTSTKFPHRAPEGYALIRIFVGRAGEDVPWNDPDLLALAREEVQLSLGISAEPMVSRVFKWDKAMPQYNLGHPEKLARIDAALKNHPGLLLAGNGYRGIGIPDCIRSGQLAVERILMLTHSSVETNQHAKQIQ